VRLRISFPGKRITFVWIVIHRESPQSAELQPLSSSQIFQKNSKDRWISGLFGWNSISIRSTTKENSECEIHHEFCQDLSPPWVIVAQTLFWSAKNKCSRDVEHVDESNVPKSVLTSKGCHFDEDFVDWRPFWQWSRPPTANIPTRTLSIEKLPFQRWLQGWNLKMNYKANLTPIWWPTRSWNLTTIWLTIWHRFGDLNFHDLAGNLMSVWWLKLPRFGLLKGWFVEKTIGTSLVKRGWSGVAQVHRVFGSAAVSATTATIRCVLLVLLLLLLLLLMAQFA